MRGGLQDQDWSELLGRLEGVGKETTKRQVQALMSVLAKASLEVSSSVHRLSVTIEKFNRSTTRLTKVLVLLTAILAVAACLQVVAIFLVS